MLSRRPTKNQPKALRPFDPAMIAMTTPQTNQNPISAPMVFPL